LDSTLTRFKRFSHFLKVRDLDLGACRAMGQARRSAPLFEERSGPRVETDREMCQIETIVQRPTIRTSVSVCRSRDMEKND